MARTFSLLVPLCYLLLHVHHIHFIKTSMARELPETKMYVFGDSIDAVGPKKSHETGMRMGYAPYGFECIMIGKFRFTNGWTVPELFAQDRKHPIPISFEEMEYFWNHEGVNYASASAGILPETGSILGKNYCMEKQVGFFKETLERYLHPKFSIEQQKYPSEQKLLESLSNAILLVNIGSSDYLFNYLKPNEYNSSRHYSGEGFAELLVNKLGNNLKDLYRLGARKFVVFEIGPLGCLPYIINRVKPRGKCDENTNKLVSIFNDKLKVKLKELSEKLEGSTFVTARTFHLIKDMVENPSNYGLTETRWPCCETQENGTGLCKPNERPLLVPNNHMLQYRMQWECEESPPPPHKSMESRRSAKKPKEDICEDRGSYLFWDELHFTKAANKVIADKCFHPTSGGICSPYDIYQLANKRY